MKINKKSNVLMITTIILTVFLISTTGLYLFKASQDGGLSRGEGVVAIVVVLLALIAVFSIVIAKKIRARKYTMLNKEFKEAIDDIMLIVGTSNMSRINKKEIREDLLDLFASAVADNKSLKDVIGSDMEGFAADIIEAHGAKNGYFVYSLSGLQYCILYLVFVQLYEYFRNLGSGAGFFDSHVEVSTVILFCMIAFLTVPLMMYMKDVALRTDRTWLMIVGFVVQPIITLGVFIGFIEMLEAGVYSGEWVDTVLNGNVVIFKNAEAVLIAAGVLLLVWLLKKRIQKTKLMRALNR